MQNKGVIKILALALILISFYYLSFTWIVNGVKDDAAEFAENIVNKESEQLDSLTGFSKKSYLDSLLMAKEKQYLDSVSGETVYNFLWIRPFSYKECLEQELNLGLDLRGGMNVTLEVSVVDLIKAMSNYSQDSTFLKALSIAREGQKQTQEDFVTLFGHAFSELDPNARLSSPNIFGTLDLRDRIKYETTNEEVLAILRTETKDAIDRSFNVLRSRIDHFGVAQPNIQRLEGTTGRILVELPGVKDPERVRKLLQGTANLEFWETFENREVFEYLRQANDELAKVFQAEEQLKHVKTDTTENFLEQSPTDSTTQASEADSLTNEESMLAETPDSSSQESMLDGLDGKDSTSTGQVSEAEKFKLENPLFSILRPSVDNENKLLSGAIVGIAHFKDTLKINQYLRHERVKGFFPNEVRFAWKFNPVDKKEAENYYHLIALKASRDGKAALGGDVITSARADFGQNQAEPVVNMSMNSEGAQQWARITKENIGRQVAVVLDGFVYSHPSVRVEITGGRSEISGGFTIVEAKDLANILKSGKLPAPARIIEEEVVGPSLGQEAIDSGMSSFIIAFLVVMIYMVFYYRGAGVVADIALITNIFFIFGVLASLGAVLTLPGIAGIVLTIGMSVDANVLIYERIREELKLGKGLRLAVSDGYKNAYSAIVDANVTTLLTGFILNLFGHGPIKGFAITLIVGILTSLFAAIFITRLVFIFLLDKKKDVTFSTKYTENAFKNLNFQFINKRKIAYVISGIIILVGIGSLITRGLNQGIDFVGGRTYVVRFDQDVNTVNITKSLSGVYKSSPEVKTFGGDNQVKITTKFMIDSDDIAADSIVEAKLYEGVKDFFKTGISYNDFKKEYDTKEIGKMSSQKVGPTIADDIKVSAVWSILFSLIVIFLYILIRFRNWQFGIGAIAALTHDVLIVIGLFSLLYGILPFSLEINQAFIAAILTVVGYSINDTVVVFDRIREFLTIHKKEERLTVYNSALNSTLSRTFSTSLSTFFVLLAIFIFGGEVIRGFIFALLIGVIVGTYSSLYIATPVVFDTIKRVEKHVEKSKARSTRKKAVVS